MSHAPLFWPLVFLLAVLAGCGLWLGKNWVLTGNPVYPLLADLLGGESRTPELIERWQLAHGSAAPDAPSRFTAESAADAAWRVLGGSQWHHPLLIPLALLAVLTHRNRSLLVLSAALFAFAIVAWWVATHRIDRFWTPMLPLLCLVAAGGGAWSSDRVWRSVVTVLVMLTAALNLAVIASPAMGDARLLVDLKHLRRDVIEPGNPAGRVNPMHAWLNRNAEPGEKVLLVGDAQPFDLEIPAIYNTVFDPNIFERWMRDRPLAERRELLRQRGVSYVYFHWGDIDRYRQPGNYGFSQYVTRERIENEFVAGRLLEPVAGSPSNYFGQLFRVRHEP